MIEDYSWIPAEIKCFFNEDYGKTLLIKGAPGSGKTVFALTLLSTLKGNGAYLSTRVDSDTLYMQHPWIKEKIAPDNIIDATKSASGPTSVAKEVSIKALKYSNVPEFLKAVYTRTEKMEHPIIIIDSWEAVAFYTGHHEQRDKEELEHNLCDVSRRTKTKIILLVEYTGQTALDYLVDGVVVVESDLFEERRLRRMVMQKLRGCQITNPVRLFSLNKGVFKCFGEFKGVEMAIENPTIPDSIPDLSATRFSTGIKDLDRVTNGYGCFNLFEGDYITYDILAHALSINALNLGRWLIFASTMHPDYITRISAFVKQEHRSNIEQVEEIKDIRDKIKDKSTIVLINLEEIEDVDTAVREIMTLFKEQECKVMCFVGRKGCDELESFASTHIKTKFISGVPCIYGEFPRTEIHAMELDMSENIPKIKLTPIV